MTKSVASVGQIEALEHLLGAAAVLALVEVVPEADELEVLAAGEQLIDGCVLAREPDHRAQLPGVGHDVVARDARDAAVGLEQRRQDPHQRRLAGAVGAQQGKHLALLGGQVDAGQRDRRSEALRDGLHFDHRSGHHASKQSRHIGLAASTRSTVRLFSVRHGSTAARRAEAIDPAPGIRGSIAQPTVRDAAPWRASCGEADWRA